MKEQARAEPIDVVLDSLDRAGFARVSLVWFYLKYAVFVAVAR